MIVLIPTRFCNQLHDQPPLIWLYMPKITNVSKLSTSRSNKFIRNKCFKAVIIFCDTKNSQHITKNDFF